MTHNAKSEIEKFLKEFALLSGTSVVEALVKSCEKKTKIRIRLENSEIKNDLKDYESIKFYSYLIDIFSQIYGSNVVGGVIHKIEGKFGKNAIQMLANRQNILYAVPFFEINI